MRAALKAGRVKRNRYAQPIDVIVSYAGSEATMASEPYDVIDGEARGMLARQVHLASTLQRAWAPSLMNRRDEGRDRLASALFPPFRTMTTANRSV